METPIFCDEKVGGAPLQGIQQRCVNHIIWSRQRAKFLFELSASEASNFLQGQEFVELTKRDSAPCRITIALDVIPGSFVNQHFNLVLGCDG